MGIFTRFARKERIEPTLPRNASPENPSTSLANPDGWLLDWSGFGASAVGPPVTERAAMAVSAVFGCVNLISGLVASLPLNIYEDAGKKGQVIAPDHKLSPLLGACPFPGRNLTSFTWRERWAVDVLLWGNHFSVIRYDNAGRVMGFEAAMPWSVEVLRLATGANYYKVTWADGRIEGVPQDEMLHFAGVSFDGIKGVSRIQSFARNAISRSRVLEDQIAYAHQNAAKPSGMVTMGDATPTPDGMRRMDAHYNDRYAGTSNTGKILFADKGSTFTPLQITPEDLTTIEAMNATAEDVCRFFKVPPTMVGITGSATTWGTGIESLTRGFLTFTMGPEFARYEHELNMKLLAKSTHYAQFDREAVVAMDALAAAQVRQAKINSGQLTPNEARAMDKRAAMEGGDNLFLNSTMVTIARAIEGPPAPKPTPQPDPNKDPNDA